MLQVVFCFADPFLQLGLGSVAGSLFPVIVYACIVDLLVPSTILFLIYIFLIFDKEKDRPTIVIGKSYQMY